MQRRLRTLAVSGIGLVLAGLACVPVMAQTSGEVDPEPRIVPTLVTGTDSSHLAAAALSAPASSKRSAAPDIAGGASARVSDAARAALDAMGSAKRSGSGGPDLPAALRRLRAAGMLLEDGYRQVAESPLARVLGLRETLDARGGTAIANWQAQAAPLQQAGERLRVTPNAKAVEQQLEQRLRALVGGADHASVFAAAQLPVHRPFAAPPELQLGNAIAASYADRSDPLPAIEDLQPSGEARFSAGVLGKAQGAGYSYVDLFDFVRSEVRTEWSVGSTQSADSTLRRAAGNDVEQASLLIALLRASGAAARYVVGVVELPIADLAQQMGVPESGLGAALSAAGIAHQARAEGGRIVAFRIRHVWVSARVPYGNYRGTTADTSEPTWIPLMPALKPAHFDSGQALAALLSPGISEWLQSQLAQVQESLPWPSLRQQWANQLAARQPPIELAQLPGTHATHAPPLRLLPASTPYPVIAVHAEHAVLPDSERQWLSLRLRAPALPEAEPLLDTRIALSDLKSQRFTLAFLPATVEDQHITNANASLGGFPLSLVRLRPSLIAEGLPALPGPHSVTAGTALEMEFELSSPVASVSHRQRIFAGSIAGFAIDAHGDAYSEIDSEVETSSSPAGGLVLNRFAQRYLAEWARAETESAALLGVRVLRPLPALAIALPQVQPEGATGLVESLRFQGVALDAALRPLEPISLQGEAQIEADWLRLSALHGSALESRLFEQLWGVRSVSADQLLQRAAITGIPVLRLAAGANLDLLAAHPAAVREQVERWVGQGFEVQIPQSPQTVEAWTGSGWRVDDSETGASGYFISGDYAGGSTAVPPGLWYFQDLAETLANPYAEPPNEDPTSVALLMLDHTAQSQRTSAGRRLDKPLRAYAVDLSGRPVQGAAVQFDILIGGGSLAGDAGPAGSSSRSFSNRIGVAQATATAPERGGDWVQYSVDTDGVRMREYVTTVRVSAPQAAAEVVAGVEFSFLMFPGELDHFEFTPAIGPLSSFTQPTLWSDNLFDPWGFVLPSVQHVNFIVRAKDEFGNPIGGQLATARVEDAPEPACLALAMQWNLRPVIASKIYTAASNCPLEPLIGEHECTSRELELRFDPEGRVGLSSVPTNLYRTNVLLSVEQGEVRAERGYYVSTDVYYTGDRECQPLDAPGVVVERSGRIPQRTARVGDGFPVPRSFGYFEPGLDIPAQGRAEPNLFGRPAPHSNPFVADGAEVSSLRSLGNGWFEFDVTAGADPRRIEVYAVFQRGGDGGAPVNVQRFLAPGWAVRLDEPSHSPDPIELNEFQRTTEDVVLTSNHQPDNYPSESAKIELFDSAGERVTGCMAGTRCLLRRGMRLEPETEHFLQYTLNPESAYPLVSDRVPVRMGRHIVAGYGGLASSAPLPRLDTLLGDRFPRQIEIQTELDIQTDYVCQTGNRFMFALGQPARVDLEVFDLHEDGSRGDSVLLALSDAAYEAGVFEEDFGLGQLYFGIYEFELRARTDDENEVHVGRIIHREKRRGSLPLARSLVKGVDVHDGHAVISAEDVAIGGRGPGLRFTRTYSSHSGDDETLLGRGWSSELESRVVPDSCGSFVVTGAAGQGQRYVPNGVDANGSPRFRSGNGFHGTFRPIANAPGTYDFFSKDGTRYHYAERDIGGTRLSFVEDTSGNRVTYEYGLAGSERVVQRIVDRAGRALELRYQRLRQERASANGVPAVSYRTLLTSLLGPASLRVEYVYAADGNLAQVTRSGGGSGQRIEEFSYQDFGGVWTVRAGQSRYYHLGYRLTQAQNSSSGSIRDYAFQLGWTGMQTADGSTFTLPELRVESLGETDGGSISFVYEGLRPLAPTTTTVTDARSNPSTYVMNRFGATERLTSPAGTTVTEWDFEHLQPRSIRDVMGAQTSYTYDEHGNRETEAVSYAGTTLSRSWSYVSPADFALPIKDRVRTFSDARSINTTYSYDSRGRRTGQSRGGVVEQFSYSGQGDFTGYTNGRGDLVTYGHDAYGYRSSESDDLGMRMSASYDARGRKLQEANGENQTTFFSYDSLDRLTRTRHSLGERSVAYDDASRTRTEFDELTNPTAYVHDAQGRVLTIRNARGHERNFRYDANGNLISETDFRGNETTHQYNAANHRTQSLGPMSKRIDYTPDAEGRVVFERISGAGSDPREASFAYQHPLKLRTWEQRRVDGGRTLEISTTYDSNGNPILIVDALSRETTQTFDHRDRLVRTRAPGGKEESFEYDGADQRIQATLNTSPAQVRAWGFDARGQQVLQVDATGARWEQGFDRAGRLIAKVDPAGGTVTYSYDEAGRLVGESGPRAEQFTAYVLDAAGNRRLRQDSAGLSELSEFDELNRLAKREDTVGTREILSYDEDGRIERREDGRGFLTASTFDALGNEQRRSLPATTAGTRRLLFEYGVHGELLSETDANSNTTTHGYDGLGRRVETRLPAVPGGGGRKREWEYDLVGNLLSFTDAAGRETRYTYNDLDQRISQTDPSPPGTTQAWTYDVAGNVLTHTDRRGIVHTFEYDAENRVTERRRDGLRIETLTYDDAGRVKTRSDARDQLSTYTVDGAGSVLTETRPLGFVQRWTYWPWGGVKTQADADGYLRRFEYDSRQRLIKETDPAGKLTTHGYDEVDNRTRSTRPGGFDWTFEFDADGKLSSVLSPESLRTRYGYDKHGNRIRQLDAGDNAIGYSFDARHRLTATDHPVGGDEAFGYNAEGELTTHTDRLGQTITHTPDGLGRTTSREYGAADAGDVSREAFVLNGDGQPTQLSQFGDSEGPQHVNRRFDNQGRLVEETDRYGQLTTWIHDEAGNRLSRSDPAGTTTYTPDRLNRTVAISADGARSDIVYSAAGRIESIAHANGARSEYQYDPAGRIEGISHRQGGSEVARFGYTYDDRGNRLTETRVDSSGEQSSTYSYDRDDRLTEVEVTGSDGVRTQTVYTLDAVGNRLSERVRRAGTLVADISYRYQAHQRLLERSDAINGQTTTYDYDDRGHLISETTAGQTTVYRPNAQDRLATLTLPGAPPVSYRYDSEGKRVERRTPTELTRFGWDGAQLRRETNAANNLLEAHDWAAGRILQSRRLTHTRYAQHDALNSPTRWSQANGAEQGQLRYDAWGTTTDTSAELPRIAYTGHYREREGSSYYAQQRYYRPGLGRFNRVDPWAGNELSPITLNKYLYANGNPLIYIDPDGRCSGNASAEFALGPSACADMDAEILGVDRGTREGMQAVADYQGNIAKTQAIGMVGMVAGGSLIQGLRTFGLEVAKYGLRGALMSRPEAVVVVGGELATTGAAVVAGVDLPQATPISAGRRALAQTAQSLDEGLDAVQSARRLASHVDVPTSALSSSAATNRVVQRSQPVTVAEGANGGPAVIRENAWNEFQSGTSGQFASRSAAAAVHNRNQIARMGVDPDSISAQAQSWQGSGRYYGVDRYRDITLRQGAIVFGGVPGQSAYYTTARGFDRYGDDAAALFQGLQVSSYKGSYRPGMTAYRVTQDVPAAFGITRANPQFGNGGAPQIYLPGYEDVLEPLYSVPLSNTRLP